jgi:SAM-dependent methyltransferase
MATAGIQPTSASAIERWTECPVCGSTSSQPYVIFDQVGFVHCDRCPTVFKSFESISIRAPDFYEKAYFHGRRSGRDRRFAHRVRKARRWIASVLEFVDARSLLDIGCSFGYVIEAGKRLGLASAGVDLSAYAVQVCRQRGHRAEVGSLEKLPFSDGEFDAVIMKHVLEHTPTPQTALAEVRRILSPGGAVLIALPNLMYWKGQYRRRDYRYFRPDDLGQQHYVYYTPASLSMLLQRSGLEVVLSSKAHYRRKRAGGRVIRSGLEAIRFAALHGWQALARGLRLQREIFVVALKRA